jgi:AraC-like DNA-binding protein
MAGRDKNIPRIIQQAFASRVQFGDVIFLSRAAFGPRVQSQFQLFLLLRGRASIRVDAETIQVSPGEIVLLKPGHQELFRFSPVTETHHRWCSIDPGLVPRELARRIRTAPRQIPISDMMEQLVTLGLRSGAGEEDTSFLAQLAICALETFLREGRAAVQHQALPEPLRRARDLIEKQYAEILSVQEIARRAGVSANHLIKLFRRYLGETPADYLWRFRADHGVRLLRETGLTIAEIAFRTGFQNPFHFSRMIRKRHGLAPRELRRQWWNREHSRGK